MPEPDVRPWDRFVEFCAEATRIFRAFSMALDAKKLLFAFLGVVLWTLGAMVINIMRAYPQYSWVLILVGGLVAILILFLVLARRDQEVTSRNFILGVIAAIGAIALLVIVLIVTVRAWPRLFDVFHLLWALLVASFFGTAVARIAALNAAVDETVGPREATRFAFRKFSTAVWTLLVPVLAVLAFGLFLIVLSVLGRVPAFGHVWYGLVGVIYLLLLLGGLFFATVLLVYVPSLLLFQPAIAVEGNDSFDAVSRSYSYVFGKPWRLAFYAVIGYVYATIVLRVAALLIWGAGVLTNEFVSRGIGAKMEHGVADLSLGFALGNPWYHFAPGPVVNAVRHVAGGNISTAFRSANNVGDWLIIFWQHIFLALFLAFAVSLFYSIVTQIYLLMRKAVDATPFDEVYVETTEEEEFAAEFAGSPAPAAPQPADAPAPPPAAEPPKPADSDKPIDLAGGDQETPQDTGH